jgi:hypothetical protein
MKPLNFDNSPCSPTASDCVIWSGPDLPCINLCKGDSISDVVEKLATELCGILDILNISAYDLTCFNLVNCAPQTFTDLINFLIVKICELENIPSTPTTPDGSAGCPTECIVDVASCFVVGSATTMSLTDYAVAIGEKVCAIIDTNALQQAAIDDLDLRVTTLEDAPAPVIPTLEVTLTQTLPSIPSLSGTQPVETVVQSYINQIWFPYVAVTGDSGLLSTSISNQTVSATDLSKVNPAAQMSAQYAGLWTTPTATIAGTLNNVWACIKDLRDGSVTVSGLDTTTINMTVTGGPAYVVSADLIPQAPSVADTATVNLSVGAGPTYTLTADVIVPGAMLASGTPSSIALDTPTATTNLVNDGTVQLITEIYDEDNAYDPITGIWTCPATGRYNLNFYVHLSKPGIGFTSGMVIAGIVSSTSTGYYVVSSATLNQVTQFVDITGTALGLDLTVGVQLQLNILNLSDVAYTTTVGDVVKLSIQKVK